MMGRLAIQDALCYRFRIERHVPPDHLLRRIDRVLDFDAIRSNSPPSAGHRSTRS